MHFPAEHHIHLLKESHSYGNAASGIHKEILMHSVSPHHSVYGVSKRQAALYRRCLLPHYRVIPYYF